MNREELLNKVKQNPINDELGRKQTTKSIFYTTAICTLFSSILIILKLFIRHELDCGLLTLIFVVGGFPDVYEGFTADIKKKKIIGIIELTIAALFFVLSICEVIL